MATGGGHVLAHRGTEETDHTIHVCCELQAEVTAPAGEDDSDHVLARY